MSSSVSRLGHDRESYILTEPALHQCVSGAGATRGARDGVGPGEGASEDEKKQKQQEAKVQREKQQQEMTNVCVSAGCTHEEKKEMHFWNVHCLLQIASWCRHTRGKMQLGHTLPWPCLESSFMLHYINFDP